MTGHMTATLDHISLFCLRMSCSEPATFFRAWGTRWGQKWGMSPSPSATRRQRNTQKFSRVWTRYARGVVVHKSLAQSHALCIPRIKNPGPPWNTLSYIHVYTTHYLGQHFIKVCVLVYTFCFNRSCGNWFCVSWSHGNQFCGSWFMGVDSWELISWEVDLMGYW